MTRVLCRVMLVSQGELGRLTVEGGHRNPEGLGAGSILNLLGGWMVGVTEGGDIRGVSDSGMLALVCPGSEMLRLNESFSDSRLFSPSLNISQSIMSSWGLLLWCCCVDERVLLLSRAVIVY